MDQVDCEKCKHFSENYCTRTGQPTSKTKGTEFCVPDITEEEVFAEDDLFYQESAYYPVECTSCNEVTNDPFIVVTSDGFSETQRWVCPDCFVKILGQACLVRSTRVRDSISSWSSTKYITRWSI